MQIKQVRLFNLRRLVSEFGTIAAVANLSNVSENYLVQLLNGHLLPSGKPRGIGDTLAGKLEKGCGKPAGWMDTTPHPGAPTPLEPALPPAARELVALFLKANPELREAILAVARLAK